MLASRRTIEPELMDTLPPGRVERNLRDLDRINRWLGGHRTIRKLVGEVARPDEQISLLDVGAASGDMGRAVCSRFRRAWVVSLDHRLEHVAGAPRPAIAADAFRLPFRDSSFDIVMCSLFLHHFQDAEITSLLADFRRLARRAVVVIDLERHPVAWRFLPATRFLAGWDRVTVHDGRISVAASFRPEELAKLASEAGFSRVRVRRHRPWFRVSLVALV
jgi:ubiquinone/menaquinone biosynthesis C-methylase UbiE